MNIGIDIDGVLTDLERFILDNTTKYCYENSIDYEIGIQNRRKLNGVAEDVFNYLSSETIESFWKENSKYYFTQIPIRNYANQVINKLKEKNKIYIITARDNQWGLCDELKGKIEETTKIWLEKSNIYYDSLIFAKDKLNACLKNNIDLIIDDSPVNIKDLKSKIKVFCFDTNYNKYSKGKNITRVYSWYDILDKFSKTYFEWL